MSVAIPTLPPTFALDIPAADDAAESRSPAWLADLKRYDEQRPGIPGEHWVALGAGALLLLSAASSGSATGAHAQERDRHGVDRPRRRRARRPGAAAAPPLLSA